MRSSIPNVWKKTKIVPIPKGNGEFRPVAIVPFLSKVLEVLLDKQISSFFEENNLITEKQSEFGNEHNCITSLIDVVEDLREKIDNNRVGFLLLSDHSKAFDCVNHFILCKKLQSNRKKTNGDIFAE